MAKRDYRQIKKDPLIDLMRTEAQKGGFIRGGTHTTKADQKHSIATLARDSGVSDTTIRNWFFGDTKRPQGFTSRLVLESLGIRTQYVRSDGTVIRQKSLHEQGLHERG